MTTRALFGHSLFAALVACSATPELSQVPDASRAFEAGGGGDCLPERTGATTFAAIYGDLLGPDSVGKCANAGCHAGDSSLGMLGMGSDLAGAYAGLEKAGLIGSGEDKVEKLVAVLSPGYPKRMPFSLGSCTNRFLTTAEIDRIKSWGRSGASRD
jgi:hypothetical protein